jgi:hypothetical protein
MHVHAHSVIQESSNLCEYINPIILSKQKVPLTCIQVKRFKEPWQFGSKIITRNKVLNEKCHNNFNAKLKQMLFNDETW